MRIRYLAVLVLLLPPVARVGAQSSWDRYQPRTLASIIAQHQDLVDTTRRSALSFSVTAQTFPTRTDVVFTGQTRPIPADHRTVLRGWARMMGIDTTRVDDYEEEWEFAEDALILWMPVQAETAASMRSSVRAGAKLTVWAQWFGTATRDGQTNWVFPVMRTMEP